MHLHARHILSLVVRIGSPSIGGTINNYSPVTFIWDGEKGISAGRDLFPPESSIGVKPDLGTFVCSCSPYLAIFFQLAEDFPSVPGRSGVLHFGQGVFVLLEIGNIQRDRSEERRVGEECVRTCRCRRWTYT